VLADIGAQSQAGARGVGGVVDGQGAIGQALDLVRHNCIEKGFLAGVMAEEGGVADAGRGGDFAHGDVLEGVAGEKGEERGTQAVTAAADAQVGQSPLVFRNSAFHKNAARELENEGPMTTYVLVHGGGHGGWCYQKVARLLRDAGHDVYTPTLTGLGERAHLLRGDTDLETHIADIVGVLTYEDLHEVILVGHSYGGMVITGVADRSAARIRELVYLDAAHPVDGESLEATAPAAMAFARSSSRIVDGVELVMWPNDEMVAAMGVTDPADVAWLRARMRPHPWKSFGMPLQLLNGDTALRVPRTNINCTASLRHSDAVSRARQMEGHRNFEIDTGHDLMITEPRKVTDMLLEVGG
jgi:pimeloyl-ACP methyl ester carboxylesterase